MAMITAITSLYTTTLLTMKRGTLLSTTPTTLRSTPGTITEAMRVTTTMRSLFGTVATTFTSSRTD